MYRKRTSTIAVVTVLLLGSVGALALIPADPATVARISAAPSVQAETIAAIDGLLGPETMPVEPPVETAIAPIDRSALQPASEPDPNIQTVALTQPVETPPAPVAATDAIGASAVNMRSGPSSKAATVSVLPPGQPIQISGEQDGWIEVTLPDGTTGWVYSRYVAGTEVADAPPPADPAPARAESKPDKLTGRTARIEASIAVRSKPAPGARTLFRTEPGERVRIIGVDGNWLQIRTVDGNLGWIQQG